MVIQPISTTRLRQICNDACDAAISTASVYEHAQTQVWNNNIINNVLKALISESTPAPAASSSGTTDKPPPAATPQYKFIVNTTIIQHLSDPRPGKDTLDVFALGEDGRFARIEPGGDGVIRSLVLPGFWFDPGWLRQRPLPDALDLLAHIAPDLLAPPNR